MLVRHLFVGVVVGAEAALAGGLLGFSVWAVLGLYLLGANLGLILSAMGELVSWRDKATHAAKDPVLMSAANQPLPE